MSLAGWFRAVGVGLTRGPGSNGIFMSPKLLNPRAYSLNPKPLNPKQPHLKPLI